MDWGNILGSVLGGAVDQTQLGGFVDKAKNLESWLMAVLYISAASLLVAIVNLFLSFRK